jgi:hypothetical protein
MVKKTTWLFYGHLKLMHKKKLPYLLRDNQFNICKAFNQNVQYPHATTITH